MEGEEGGGIRLSKRFSNDKGGEVDYKNKSGTAWSHSYLNQKPWHPLSYPNQRRKWIAEQTHAQRQRRAEEVAREYSQEQEFYRQTALISKKEKEKVELMQAVSFMYVRPPGYNAESAKAAEIADEQRKEELSKEPQDSNADRPSSSMPPSSLPGKDNLTEKKKPRPKDVFGRPLPTEEEFEILKNAPRLETGVAGRVKPFGVEIRNVKCLRCGAYGHQSGDRECPLKDAIMPNEESRLKRDDPLNAILAHTDTSEPLKWELKQKPGISPPRGGFKPDDPNQQIVADDEDIFDEYGGFLSMDNIPELLTNITKKPKKSKKSKRKKQQPAHSESEVSSDEGEGRSKKKKVKVNKKKRDHAKSSSSDTSDFEKDEGKSRHKNSYSSAGSDSDRVDRSRKIKQGHSFSPKGSDHRRHRSEHGRHRHSFPNEGSGPDEYHGSYKNSDKHSYSSEDSDSDRDDSRRKNIQKHKMRHNRKTHSYSLEDSANSQKHSYSSEDSDSDRDDRSRKYSQKHERKHGTYRNSYFSEDSGPAAYHGNHKSRDEHSYSLEDSDHPRQSKAKRSSHKHSLIAHGDSQRHNRNYGLDRYHGSEKRRAEHSYSYSSEDSDVDKDDQSRKVKQKHRYKPEGSEHDGRDMSKQSREKHSYSSKGSGADKYHRSEKGRYKPLYSSESDDNHHRRHLKVRSRRHKH